MSDMVMKILALAAFVASLAVFGWYVPDVSLIAVLALVSAMAAYDFFVRPALARRRPNPKG